MVLVNQNGSYDFDQVVKASTVLKRTRRTRQWKLIYIVLRPNILSIYRNKDETKLRHQINLSEITAVARQKDSKGRVQHVFCIFSPSRNYHFSAASDIEAQVWVDRIRGVARIDEDREEGPNMSPVQPRALRSLTTVTRTSIRSSSSECEARLPGSGLYWNTPNGHRPASQAMNLSSHEYGSYSDFSDTGEPLRAPIRGSVVSLPHASHHTHKKSQPSNNGAMPEENRVIAQGWLYVLKSRGGVRQWKQVWVVLRPKALGIYKNDQEYAARLILPFSNIIDAVDIDPASRRKQFCMQIISEEQNLRFCAPNEQSLDKWLGALKSLLAKRKEAQQQRMLR